MCRIPTFCTPSNSPYSNPFSSAAASEQHGRPPASEAWLPSGNITPGMSVTIGRRRGEKETVAFAPRQPGGRFAWFLDPQPACRGRDAREEKQ